MTAMEGAPLVAKTRMHASSRLLNRFKVGVAALALVGVVGVVYRMHQLPPAASVVIPSSLSAFAANNIAPFPGEPDEIIDLPGKPAAYTPKLYSGFLSLANGGQMFYFLATSQSVQAPTDPVMLWLNGGPGASSLLGCFSEIGPLLFQDDATLRVNPYAWNQHANLLCLESPVGVGFSYNTSSVYVSDDLAQADDIYDALQAFFTKFPHLAANDFVIAGESYGGVYVPTTARAIVRGNAAHPTWHINLVKWAVGNGVNEFAGLSQVVWAYYHGLIGTDEYKNMRATCPGFHEFEPTPHTLHPSCKYTYFSILQALVVAHINSYDIFAKCHGGDLNHGLDKLLAEIETPHHAPLHHPFGLALDLCLNSTASRLYFNDPAVRRAIHTDTIPFPLEWSNIALTSLQLTQIDRALNVTGNDDYALAYNRSLDGHVTSLWRYLLDEGVPGVIYHGDSDIMCDFISGQWAVESLRLPRKSLFQPWFIATDDDGQDDDGGFVEEFQGLTFVTVKGAGHMVPQNKPIQALAMLEHYILDTPAARVQVWT
ncbi:Aste57867_17431 [Aphanomyces stellatus]|uniref:Carboxypeptidase n=1 Tax=Aphanomyces stellatus TaxID=120398 RepID=A0A485LBC6_9STRA|nr:hypothetical protein As57867_017371 [Aphanomyces stellatus]VFT94187.1 Aste57867_17431 [Aphanomyces stellatus]